MAIRISGEWKDPCPDCGALGGCCETAKARLETLDSMGKLVKRQSDSITKLTREVAEAYQVIADIRREKTGAA